MTDQGRGGELTCENYTYLQEQEAASLAECCSDTQQSAPSKSSHTVRRCLEPGNETESCQDSQSSETSENLMEPNGEGQLMLFAEVSPARTSAQQAKAQESAASAAACGQKWRELLARFSLDLRLLKTPRCCGPEDFQPSSKTLPRWGMMQGGECWELGTLVRPISATGCGSWPTPSAHKTTSSGELVTADGATWTGAGKPHSAITGKPVQTALMDKVLHWPTPARRDHKGANSRKHVTQNGTGRKHMDHLPNAVAYPELRGGTKTRQKWATPRCFMYKDALNYRGKANLGEQVNWVEKVKKAGQLNPSWVEWLMGWPIGWTDLKPLETDRFQQWQQQHSKFFQKGSSHD